MIILHKKRLIIIGSFLFIFIVAFSFKEAFSEPETVATVNLPASNKVIVLDAGHGKPDERS